MANEVNSFNQPDINRGYNSSNLTGYQLGLIYQSMAKKSGFGFETGALLSQKGSSFSDSTSTVNIKRQGYRELTYLEIPLNIRYQLALGVGGIYGTGGIYGGYIINGKDVDEITNNTQKEHFSDLSSRIDYGYSFGAGMELFHKIQFGATWTRGLKNTSTNATSTTKNKVFSINLVYLF